MKNKIKSLELMGYSVLPNDRQEMVHISFTGKKGYGVYLTIGYNEMEKDFIVEEIVRKINRVISEDI